MRGDGTDIIEDIETITLQPIGKGVQDLDITNGGGKILHIIYIYL